VPAPTRKWNSTRPSAPSRMRRESPSFAPCPSPDDDVRVLDTEKLEITGDEDGDRELSGRTFSETADTLSTRLQASKALQYGNGGEEDVLSRRHCGSRDS